MTVTAIAWIDVQEGLPDGDEPVLIFLYDRTIGVARCIRGRTAAGAAEAGVIQLGDVHGNNRVPYCWRDPHGPMTWFGQDVTHWAMVETP